MTDIAEITQRDREKIKKYVEGSKFLTYTMLAERFGISKSELSLIINGKRQLQKRTKLLIRLLSCMSYDDRRNNKLQYLNAKIPIPEDYVVISKFDYEELLDQTEIGVWWSLKDVLKKSIEVQNGLNKMFYMSQNFEKF